MSEVRDVALVTDSSAHWLILSCGHWLKWTGDQVPEMDSEIACPSCRLPTVQTPAAPPAPPAGETALAGLPVPPPVSDAEVIAAIRGVLWEAMRGRDIGGDRTLVGMVKQLVAERDEARENRRGEFDLRMEAEARSRQPAPAGETARERIDPWVLDRVERLQKCFEVNAGRFGVKLLRGHGYPNEVMSEAQDALALREAIAALRSAPPAEGPAIHGANDNHAPAGEPDMAVKCSHCGAVWGEHIGPKCPDGEGTFKSQPAREEAARGAPLPLNVSIVRREKGGVQIEGHTTQQDWEVEIDEQGNVVATDLPPAGETARERIAVLLCDVAQLLDGWHQDGTAWTEWDESVRQRVSQELAALRSNGRARERILNEAIAAIQHDIDHDIIAATSGGKCIAMLQSLRSDGRDA